MSEKRFKNSTLFWQECTGSICLAYGMESCQCRQGPDDADTKACELCCKEPGEGKQCVSSFELGEPPLEMPGMFSKPGTPCNDYQVRRLALTEENILKSLKVNSVC